MIVYITFSLVFKLLSYIIWPFLFSGKIKMVPKLFDLLLIIGLFVCTVQLFLFLDFSRHKSFFRQKNNFLVKNEDKIYDRINQLQQQLNEQSNNYKKFINLALLNYNVGNNTESLRLCDKALGVTDDINVFLTVIDLHVRISNGKMLQAAYLLAKKIIARDPKNNYARYYLGIYEYQNNNPEMSLAIFKGLLLDIDDEFPFLNNIKNIMKILLRNEKISFDEIKSFRSLQDKYQIEDINLGVKE